MKNKIIEVCSECRTAACWYGEFMCDMAQNASTILVSQKILADEKREHPSYWSDEEMGKIYGEVAPHGYDEK
jgi:hypothetical protein